MFGFAAWGFRCKICAVSSEMAQFNIDQFLEQPSFEQLASCRKADLFEIASYFSISHSRQLLKKELRDLIVNKLVELNLLSLPSQIQSSSALPTVAEPAAETESAGPSNLAERPQEQTPEGDMKVVGGIQTPVTLPRFDPLSASSGSVGSKVDARLKVRLARLQAEAEEKAQLRQYQLEIKRLEIEAEKAIKLRQLELEYKARFPIQTTSESPSSSGGPSIRPFDVTKYVSLVPEFREAEIDSYFSAFERIAQALQWPPDVWSLLLQCRIHGKAQEVVAALPLSDTLKYDVVKAAILKAYELVPEAYRQKFRSFKKSPSQTYVEFAREKGSLFDRWCASNKVTNFDTLRELVLLEEFKNCLPERVVVHLNEQKVNSLSSAAVLADEYVLTHKSTFQSVLNRSVSIKSAVEPPKSTPQKNDKECFYCHKTGHLIANCLALKRKEQNTQSKPKGVGLIRNQSPTPRKADLGCTPDPCYEPFLLTGYVSLPGKLADPHPVRILRDTGASQSIMLTDSLPFSELSSCGYSVVLQGLEMGYVPRPVHLVQLQSELISGIFPIAVCSELPVKGISLLLGNDIAGGKVTPSLEILDVPCSRPKNDDAIQTTVSTSCVLTRAQKLKRNSEENVDLSDSVLMSIFSEEEKVPATTQLPAVPQLKPDVRQADFGSSPISRSQLCAAQKVDPTLKRYFSGVVSADKARAEQVAFYVNDGVLMRKWCPVVLPDADWNVVHQIVIPSSYRKHILALAHEGSWAGHLGVTKTYQNVLKHFYWPGLKTDVRQYCRSCHTCQVTGKPNQVIPPAPLHPISVVGEPFERIIMDCVGPLPRTKSGNQFLLTLMCASTRYPEAIPLRKITSSSVVKAMTKFFSTFGLPRVIQTDQGTNFQSKLFKQVLKELNIQHTVSSAYHPESQGALERWHQTLKSMLRKYCIETEKDWDEGLPFVLFAAREAIQESLRFSPAELVFGHTLRSPLKILKEKILEINVSPQENILDYVCKFRERLHQSCAFAKETLGESQRSMKKHYDQSALSRSFAKGEKVLALLPVPGSTLSAKFSGPYVVQEKLSETDYVISTPERRRKSRVCHINMLKPYYSRDPNGNPDRQTGQPLPSTCSSALIVRECSDSAVEDGLTLRSISYQSSRLSNSEMLKVLPNQLSHLTEEQKNDIIVLLNSYPELFRDVPTQTSVLKHDIDVAGAKPIKQHPYRTNPVKRILMNGETDYMLQHGFAKQSSSPWSSPCLLEMKPDGSPRFITDFRKVNSVTVIDSYPLPRIEDCVDTIGNANFVSKLDLLKGYWQVPLTDRASEISAFVTPDQFLQYTVMAFGMCNAPATFQRLVNTVLSGLPNCNAYLDDLIVYTSTWEEHIKILKAVFTRLADASLTVNLAKCDFGKATVTYLGRQVGRGQVCPLEAKIKAIVQFPVPSTRKALRRFLGMASYYRNFCRNFSTVAHPLTTLLSPKVDFVWTPECQHAFESIKSLLSHAPVLSSPDMSKAFKLEVDASAVGAGAVLLQEGGDGADHPVCYFSRKFTPSQLNYSIIEKETLALLLALQHFEVYLGSSPVPITVYTDHNPLVFLSRMYNHNQRLMRWALLVQDYHLNIKHKKGADNFLADALSRV